MGRQESHTPTLKAMSGNLQLCRHRADRMFEGARSVHAGGVSQGGRGRMKRIVVAVVLLAACVLGPSVQAHHSFAASYLENEWVTIEGQLVQFQLRNPHSFVQMVVREPDGRDVRYSVEWRGAGELVAQGVTNGTLRIG